MNGDAIPDVAVVCANSSTICVRLGNGRGGFAPGTDVLLGGGLLKLVSTDLNQDGAQDLLVAGASSQSVTALLGDGRGGFRISASRTLASAPQGLTTADACAN